ncbi:MAG: hypothetical protein A2Z15_06575, partial [Chloroflexi bacterium RBG_16_50_11]
MKKIGILYHPKVAATRKKAGEIASFLKKNGISTWLCSAWDKDKARARLDGTALLITVGGDGTILRAAQVVLPWPVPILAINLGKLGFLTELDAAEAPQRLPEFLDGKGWLDERAMLQAELVDGAREARVFHALNDVVVARGEIARLIKVAATIDGEHVADYKADGVVVATATGSTGYALAARGPILYPQSKDINLAPIPPHLSLAYPLVVSGTSTVTLRLHTYLAATLS